MRQHNHNMKINNNNKHYQPLNPTTKNFLNQS